MSTHNPSTTTRRRPRIAWLVVAASVSLGAIATLALPGTSQVQPGIGAFVIPYNGYMEIDGQPAQGSLPFAISIGERNQTTGRIEVSIGSQSVVDGRFSFRVLPSSADAERILAMNNPTLRVQVNGRWLPQEQALPIAPMALQSGRSTASASFEAGLSVSGQTTVTGDVHVAVNPETGLGGSIAANRTVTVAQSVEAASARIGGDVRVNGNLTQVGGIHLTASPSAITSLATVNFNVNDIDVMTASPLQGATIRSPLTIGAVSDGVTPPTNGNGSVLVGGALRIRPDSIDMPGGHTLSFRTGSSPATVNIPGGLTFDGRIANFLLQANTIRFFFPAFVNNQLVVQSFEVVTTEVVVTVNSGENTRSAEMTPSGSSFCALTGVSSRHQHERMQCSVTQGASRWLLEARAPEGNVRGSASFTCRAHCVTF